MSTAKDLVSAFRIVKKKGSPVVAISKIQTELGISTKEMESTVLSMLTGKESREAYGYKLVFFSDTIDGRTHRYCKRRKGTYDPGVVSMSVLPISNE